MKRAGLWCLFFLGSISWSWSQITVTNSVFPAVGDTLYYFVDDAPTGIVMTPPGGDQQWDFSGLKRNSAFQEIYRDASEGSAFASFPTATLFYQTDMAGPETYLRVTPQQVAIVGFSGGGPATFGIDLDVSFTPPLVQARAPVNFFDINSIGSSIRLAFPADLLPGGGQLPVTPDSIRVRVNISGLVVVDGWGSLTIPGGQYDVLREKSTTFTETRIDAKIPAIGWLDVTDLAGQFVGLNGLGTDTSVVYRFISNESKEAIAVCETDSTQLQVISVQFKNIDRTTGIHSTPSYQGSLVLFPNPASEVLHITGIPWDNVRGDVVIRSILGQEAFRSEVSARPVIPIDISGLGQGLYICEIYHDGQLVASQVFVRK